MAEEKIKLPKDRFALRPGLLPLIADLSTCGAQAGWKAPRDCMIDRRNLKNLPLNALPYKPRQDFWHADGEYSYIVGGPVQRYNTLALALPDAHELGLEPDGRYYDRLQGVCDALAENASHCCQPGPYEILEMTAWTPHRSSPHFREPGNQFWSFIQVNIPV